MRMGLWKLTVLVVASSIVTAHAATNLRLLGQAAVPPGAKGAGTEQVAFDDREKVAYLIGDNKLHIIDLAPSSLLDDGFAAASPRALSVLQTLELPTTVNDVAFCGGYLALSANGASKVLPGTVTIFNRYLRPETETASAGSAAQQQAEAAGSGPGGAVNGTALSYQPTGAAHAASLEQLAQFTVGALPDQLTFSKDCRTILVSNEGEPETYSPPSLANDPEGSVSVINLRFCDERGYRHGYDNPGYPDSQVQASSRGTYGHSNKEHKPDHGYSGSREHKHHYQAPEHDHYHQHYSQKEEYHHDHYDHHSYDDRQYYGKGPRVELDLPDCSGAAAVVGNVRTAGFAAWNDKKAALQAQGVKITGLGATVAQDLEPEYTTFSQDERIAFVSLQENNAMAVLDVEAASFRGIHALGLKDHNVPGNELDASDKDGAGGDKAAILRNWRLYGMYQPDEIASYRYKGADYVVTANEGDGREWPGLRDDAARVKEIAAKLDPAAFPDAATLVQDANLGRLRVLALTAAGATPPLDKAPYPPYSDPNGTGKFSRLVSLGARSFSIWKLNQGPYDEPESDSLQLVFDSAAQLEQISQEQIFDLWNSQYGNVGNSSFDVRSTAKGPEPEGVAIGPCGNSYYARPYDYRYLPPGYKEADHAYDEEDTPRTCLYLGTERLGVVFVYDITNPYKPVFQSFARPPTDGPGGLKLSAPEGLTHAEYTVNGRSFGVVLVAYEANTDDPSLPAGLGVYAVL